MTKALLTIVVGVALVGALTGAGIAASDDAEPAARTKAPGAEAAQARKPRLRQLVLYGRGSTQTSVDNQPEGPSVGDEVIITSRLFTKASGSKNVGRLDVHRVITSTDGQRTRVVDQISESVTQGQIVSAGSSTFAGTPGNLQGERATRAVVGGTGQYRGIGGELRTSLLRNGTIKLTHRFSRSRRR